MLQQVGDARGVDGLAALLLKYLDGVLDDQGDQAERSRCGAGLHLIQGLLHLVCGEPHKGAVEHSGQQLQLGVGQLIRQVNELVAHHRAVGHHHGDEGVFLYHQQIIPFYCHPLFGLGHSKDGVVADLGEHLARPVDDPVQLLHFQVQRVVDTLGLLHGELVLTHELIDVEPVAHGGGDPSGGGVGLFQITHLGQIGHLISYGGGGDVQSRLLGHGLGTYRLGGGDVDLYDGPQNTLFPIGQLHSLTSVSIQLF